MISKLSLTLLVGPVITVPAPPEVVEAFLGAQVTVASGQRTGFQLTFAVSRTSLLMTTLIPAGYFDPGIRVILVVTVNGVPTPVIDGLITRQELGVSDWLEVTQEAIDAFATIQRRVDALAIVHRSHFAELEVNHGIALRPIIGELASNLRASIPAGMPSPTVTLDLAQACAHQDVAVSVAFLLVELIETAMMRVPGTSIAISLDEVEDQPERARLTARSPALRRDAAPVDPHFEQFERVIGGLARQLRSPLERDEGIGIVAIEIMVMPDPNLR